LQRTAHQAVFMKSNSAALSKVFESLHNPNRALKKCHYERFSAKQSLKIKGLLRQKTPRNDFYGVFQHPAKLSRRNNYATMQKLIHRADLRHSVFSY
jgi:hypothetical protein